MTTAILFRVFFGIALAAIMILAGLRERQAPELPR